MKKHILSALFIGGLLSAQAQMVPVSSPKAKVYQMVGLTEIEIEYSRPAAKDRQLFGDLIPFGELWRTGANKATKISFSSDVNINGVDVRAGEYSVFTLPTEQSIMVIFNNDTELWGTGKYDEGKVAARTEVRLEESRNQVESMRFTFENVMPESADLVWAWGRHAFRLPVKASARELAMERISTEISKIENSQGVYNQAAGYYLDNKLDEKKALEWAMKSVEAKEAYWNTYTLARAYHANGDKKNAKKTAELALRMAKGEGNRTYMEFNEKLLEKINKM